MKKKQNDQSREQIVVVASGSFSPPNLIRTDDQWMGIPIQWIHLVPQREQLESVRIVLHLQYRATGDNDAETETEV